MDAELNKPWSSFEYWYFITQVVSALGTIIVATIAIFGERIRRWFLKPKLKVEVGSISPLIQLIEKSNSPELAVGNYPNQGLTTQAVTIERRLVIRIEIANTGKGSAINPQVIAKGIHKKHDNVDTSYKLRDFVPIAFGGNGSSIESSNRQISPVRPIYPIIAEIVEISSPIPDAMGAVSRECSLQILIDDPSQNTKFIPIGKGTALLPIVIVADNLDEELEAFIQIHWNGNSLEGNYLSAFSIAALSKPKFQELIKA